MNLVIDANVLFAALIKEGKTIEILLNPHFNFYAPEFLFGEFNKYKSEILHKTHRSEQEFSEIFGILREIIVIVPRDKYKDKLQLAESFSPDKEDVDYFALALNLNCDIWSNDKELKKQNKIKVYSTEELVDSLK